METKDLALMATIIAAGLVVADAIRNESKKTEDIAKLSINLALIIAKDVTAMEKK